MREDEGRVRTQVLGLAQSHAWRHTEGLRLLGGGNDVLVPAPDDDW